VLVKIFFSFVITAIRGTMVLRMIAIPSVV